VTFILDIDVDFWGHMRKEGRKGKKERKEGRKEKKKKIL
jgi:hypothetical protein